MNTKQFLHTKKRTVNKQGGFTLIEILISITIFAIVMVIAVGALVTIIDANRKSHSMQLAVNNVNAAVDHMSWQIRNGSDYYCVNGDGDEVECTDDTGLSFTASDGSTYTYRLVDGRIQRIISKDGDEEIADITSHSDEVQITNLHFSLIGTSDNAQPGVTITVRGEAGTDEQTNSDFNIQTTVSERFSLSYEGESNASAYMQCPFEEKPGRAIVDFYEIKGGNTTVRGDHSNACDWIGGTCWGAGRSVSELIPVSSGGLVIGESDYNIYAATFDNDNERSTVPGYENFDEQPGEVAYFGFLTGAGLDERRYGNHVGNIFQYTKNTEDILLNESMEDCEYDDDDNPLCYRQWSGLIEENYHIDQPIDYIKVFHGHPTWQSFAYSFSPTVFRNDPDLAEDRAYGVYGHDPNLELVDGTDDDEMVATCYGDSSSRAGCANSFVVLCMAFDDLNATGELEIEDF